MVTISANTRSTGDSDSRTWPWPWRLRRAVGLAFLVGWLAVLHATPSLRNGHGTALAAPAQPNVLLIVADDMRSDGLQAMPTLRSLAAQGVTFSQAMVTSPLCCPSRASILSGEYASHHG